MNASQTQAVRFETLRQRYLVGTSVATMLEELDGADAAWADPAMWITRLTPAQRQTFVAGLGAAPAPEKPLWGLPFGIKDNIDLAGVPTTAACPSFGTQPASRSAFVVERLVRAGAIPVGKTNLDQFATGLVGVRSPYGTPRNPFDADYLPGGSSSGSATAVSTGLASFTLGTDTAGSGRVPAAFNELIGVKPTRGLISTRGLVPACRSLDCISIFAGTVQEAAEVLHVAAAYDAEDALSRPTPATRHRLSGTPRLGVPAPDQREFFGDTEAAALFEASIQRARDLGWQVLEIDYRPFAEAAQLLYGGPWVAERAAAVGDFIASGAAGLHPITTQIIGGAKQQNTVDAFRAFDRLAALKRHADTLWKSIDAMLTPTTPTVYRTAEVEADPIRLNSRLGYYTNHFNLFDLCGLAVPAGRLRGHLPWGVTLSAPAFHDDILLQLGAQWMGELPPSLALTPEGPWTDVAVCGAHLSGLPLNGQLLALGGRLVRTAHTAPQYRLVALPGTQPPKPGLFAVERGGGRIAVEVWRLPVAAFGEFVRQIPPPLGIGTLLLDDGTRTQGFLCETAATAGAQDITELGGWRAYLARR